MYKFYIDGVLLPITPSSMKISIKNKDEEIDLANGSTMTVLNKPGLTEYSFSFRAPNKLYPFAMYEGGFMGAPAFISTLNTLKENQKPFTFKVIRGTTYVNYRDINTLVSLESYNIEEDADNGGDYIIDVTLKRYIQHNTIKTINGKPVNVNGEHIFIVDEVNDRETPDIPITTYVVQEGDTFQSISQKLFGSMDYAQAIAEYNFKTYTVDELEPGLILTINKEEMSKSAKKIDEELVAKQKLDLLSLIDKYEGELKLATLVLQSTPSFRTVGMFLRSVINWLDKDD